jgi:hypothetical protein
MFNTASKVIVAFVVVWIVAFGLIVEFGVRIVWNKSKNLQTTK